MGMPLLAYFTFVAAALLILLNLSSYALPDLGSPIETSQLVGLPKTVELRPDPRPLMTAVNFGAREKESDRQLSRSVSAKYTGPPKRRSARLAKLRRTDHKSARREHVGATYSYTIMMSIH